MTYVFSSPRVLVLQHRRILPHLERELNEDFGGKPPPDRLDLIPYAGAHCRSGWCTSESACALLMTAGGGHVYELGVGKAPVMRGRLPSVEDMEALFQHASTRFIGNADREAVSSGYLQLRTMLQAYDEERVPVMVRKADTRMLESNGLGLLVVLPLASLGIGIALAFVQALAILGLLSIVLSSFAVLWVAALTLPSRILREHLATVLFCRSRDNLEYTFQCSLIKPPFRPRTHNHLLTEHAVASDSGVEMTVPECFLLRSQPRSGARSMP